MKKADNNIIKLSSWEYHVSQQEIQRSQHERKRNRRVRGDAMIDKIQKTEIGLQKIKKGKGLLQLKDKRTLKGIFNKTKCYTTSVKIWIFVCAGVRHLDIHVSNNAPTPTYYLNNMKGNCPKEHQS